MHLSRLFVLLVVACSAAVPLGTAAAQNVQPAPLPNSLSNSQPTTTLTGCYVTCDTSAMGCQSTCLNVGPPSATNPPGPRRAI